MRLKTLFFISLFMSLGVINGHCATTSYDHTFAANDVFASDFHTRLNSNFTKSLTGGINSVNAANVTDDSIGEAEMADEINPRIRTYEGAACEKVESGLLPSTDSDLTSDISLGTAYPRGYRIRKSSATPKTYTASKWTYVDIDINGDFQYSEVAINASAPSVASNSIRLARVSTDGATINTVTDLRTTSCVNGPFSNLTSSTDSNEPNLNDVFKNGQPVRRFSPAGRTPQGFAQGFFVSWDTATTFKVTSGSAYVNGEYRSISTDITVPQTADDPSNGTSGIDSGAIATSTGYNVFLVADADSTKTPSVTYSTATTPAGVTNSRLIGRIVTDATSLFTSRDVATVHGISDREVIGAWANFDGDSTPAVVRETYNISSFSDNNTGDYTFTIDSDFNSANYVLVGTCGGSGNPENCRVIVDTTTTAQAAGVIRIATTNTSNTRVDSDKVNVIMAGDSRR